MSNMMKSVEIHVKNPNFTFLCFNTIVCQQCLILSNTPKMLLNNSVTNSKIFQHGAHFTLNRAIEGLKLVVTAVPFCIK